MNQNAVIGKWKPATYIDQDGKVVNKKFPFKFTFLKNGMSFMKFLGLPIGGGWECDGNSVIVHMNNKDMKLMMADDQLVLEGDNHSKVFFRKAA